MQIRKTPLRSNRERTQTTRRALVQAARERFIRNGYAQTATPELVAAAGVTRGALYHHFKNKRELFHHVLEAEARAVAAEIEAAGLAKREARTAREALRAGTAAYLDAMTVPGRTRLLLIEGPAVLGSALMQAMDAAHAGRTLREGLKAALPPGADLPVPALAVLLSSAFDRAALAIEAGGDAAEFRQAMMAIIERVLGDEQR